MKRLIILFSILLIAVIASIYIFIPNQIIINQNVLVKANKDGLSRKLFDEKRWNDWWPGTADKNDYGKSFTYDNSVFIIDKQTIGSIYILVTNKKTTATTALNLINSAIDTTQLFWTGTIPTSYNPLARLQIYFESIKLEKGMGTVLKKLQSFYSKTENIYGHQIKKEAVVDSFLISTYNESKNYPSIDYVYRLIDQLKKYTADHGAKESAPPMFNVSTTDSINYLTRVAIPVDRILPSENTISFKRMPAGGNILVSDIKGGLLSVNNAFHQVQNYISDYHQSAPAIPFFSLITDRRKEPDTTKWITRIYYPVM
jgi:uncharacterized protein YxeA